MNKLEQFLVNIKQFMGEKWFNEECAKAGDIPDPKNTHPIIYSCIKTNDFLNNKPKLKGLTILPKKDIIDILMFGSYLKLVTQSKIVDLEGQISTMTIQDYFQSRLRSTTEYHSALYEIKVACLYLREGYIVNFINDTKKTPEFFIECNDARIFVECKRIGKKRITKLEGDTIRKLHNNLKKKIANNGVGIVIVCPGEFSNHDNWIGKKIRSLIDNKTRPIDNKTNDYYFKVFNPSLSANLPGRDIATNIILFHEHTLNPFIDKQLENSYVTHKNIIFEQCAPKITTTPESQLYELENYFSIALQSFPATIFKAKKLINKAYRQLPKEGDGLIYIDMPPYDARDEEIKEFHKMINRELSMISRINAIVFTGMLYNDEGTEHLSSVIMNDKSKTHLPNNFSIIPLLDKFSVSQ